MDEKIIARRLAIVPTTHCSLNCRLCCDFLNGPVKRQHISFEQVCKDVDSCFELIDHVVWLQFVGGEVFLYRDFAKLLNYVQKYRERFDRIIIESNGTIVPDEEVQQAMLSYGSDISLFISDYGELSRACKWYVDFSEEHNIECRLKKYHGEDQYYNGWIDNNNPQDLHEPGDVLEVNAKNCVQCQCENMHCYNGRLFRCSNSCFMEEMNLFPSKEGDFVVLQDESISKEAKKDIIRNFYKYARQSCRYCKFKYIGILPRHSAAEQL